MNELANIIVRQINEGVTTFQALLSQGAVLLLMSIWPVGAKPRRS